MFASYVLSPEALPFAEIVLMVPRTRCCLKPSMNSSSDRPRTQLTSTHTGTIIQAIKATFFQCNQGVDIGIASRSCSVPLSLGGPILATRCIILQCCKSIKVYRSVRIYYNACPYTRIFTSMFIFILLTLWLILAWVLFRMYRLVNAARVVVCNVLPLTFLYGEVCLGTITLNLGTLTRPRRYWVLKLGTPSL